MELSDNLQCLFNTDLTQQGESYVIEIPAKEIDHGPVDCHDTYRVAVLASDSADQQTASPPSKTSRNHDDPPVETGDTRTVDIVDVGEQGDGIAKIERGFVFIVPDAEIGATVTVEIVHVTDSYAIAEVIDDDPNSGVVFE